MIIQNGEVIRIQGSSYGDRHDINGITQDSSSGNSNYFRLDTYDGGFQRDRDRYRGSFQVERLV